MNLHSIFSRSLAAALLCGAVLATLAGCGGSVELLTNMNERDANEIVGVLSESDIRVQKIPAKDGAVNLMVDPSNVARAIELLSAEGMPREHRATMGDVFRKEGLISSPLEERARYLWALSQELSETISQIDGVLRARVHVVLPERSTGGEAALPSSAGVFVKYRRGMSLEEQVPQIKRLVASSIPGLNADKVSVILVANGAPMGPVAAAAPGAGFSPMSSAQAAQAGGAAAPGLMLANGRPVRAQGTSVWQITAYVLAALSVLCMAGLAGWRVWLQRRSAVKPELA